MSKLETRHLPIEMVSVEMSGLVTDLMKKLMPFAIEKNQEVQLTLEEVYVRGHRGKLEQLWINIITNAIRYSPENAMIKISVVDKGERVEAFVENYGAHIDEASLKKVWTPFYREEKSRSRETGGNGLGLSIVKAILDVHQGTYSITNTEYGVRLEFSLTKA